MRFLAFLSLFACTGKDDTANPTDSDSAADDTAAVPPDAPNLVVNEFLASNDTVNADEVGEFDDWVEVYNAGDVLVTFADVYLTDDLEAPTKWALPSGSGLDAGDYLLLWCDDAPEQGDRHAPFKLAADAGVVALYFVVDGFDPVRLDGVNYELQETDLSSAQVPDGSGDWQPGQTPTPEASNG